MKTFPCLLAVLAAGAVGAAEGDGLDGRIAIGWREVSTNGDHAKYAEDTNLGSGPRLFDANLVFTPDANNKNWPNLIAVDLQGIGGDPYESIRFEVRNYGAYRFRVNRQRSEYFYDDVIVPADEASISGSTGGDFHRYDYERVRDDVSLDLQVHENADINLGFERYQKRGSSTTTLDVQRDEFELDKPIDESMQVFRVGGSYSWENVTLSLEERIRDYDNRNSLFLPGSSLGENVTDPTTLDFLFLDQPYSYRSNEHILRLVAQPVRGLEVKIGTLFSELDLKASAAEQAQGIDFLGNAFTSDAVGDGEIGRDISLLNLDLKYSLGDKTQLIAGVRRHSVDQSAGLVHGVIEGGLSEWDIDTSRAHFGILMALSSRVSMSAGWVGGRRESIAELRPTSGAESRRRETTDSDGFFGSLEFRLSKRFRLTASVDDTTIDDPFTLASATDSARYRLRAKYHWESGWTLTASKNRSERKNGSASWAAETTQSNIRLNYASNALKLSFGVSQVDWSRDFQRLVAGGFRQDLFDVAYNADSSYLDAKADWTVSDRLRIGGSYSRYDNDGSFAVRRDDVRGFVQLGLPAPYSLRLSYRNIDFSEPGTEQYDADIVEVSLIAGF